MLRAGATNRISSYFLDSRTLVDVYSLQRFGTTKRLNGCRSKKV